MAPSSTIASLFTKRPWQWGLRGDPYLWQELETQLGEQPLPDTVEEFAHLLATAFEALVGLPLNSTEHHHYLERHSHGGMSSGLISFEFWRETAVPLLIERYLQQ